MEARSSDPVLLLGVPDVWGDEVLENTGFSLKKSRNFVNIPPPRITSFKNLCARVQVPGQLGRLLPLGVKNL